MSTHSRNFFLLAVLFLAAGVVNANEPSTCYGTTANGTLENGWKLPHGGKNFRAYSAAGRLLGRAYVHSVVYEVTIAAYSALEKSAPGKVFVYGETGFEAGGQFKPHKTHRNGLSVDFMVPVLNEAGESVALPTSIVNKWGYDLEFDSSGTLGQLRIDAEAMAEHVYQLQVAAESLGVGIRRVIFDPKLQPILHKTSRWQYLKESIRFSEKPSWVRHDEHYHVDFEIQCEPVA